VAFERSSEVFMFSCIILKMDILVSLLGKKSFLIKPWRTQRSKFLHRTCFVIRSRSSKRHQKGCCPNEPHLFGLSLIYEISSRQFCNAFCKPHQMAYPICSYNSFLLMHILTVLLQASKVLFTIPHRPLNINGHYKVQKVRSSDGPYIYGLLVKNNGRLPKVCLLIVIIATAKKSQHLFAF